MLVLTRKTLETIRIGGQITISVLKIKGRTVRLGIEAPGEVPVVRGELTAGTDGPITANRPATVAEAVESAERRAEPASAAEQIASPLRLSTQHVNRILAVRRRVGHGETLAEQPVVAAS